MGRRIRHLGEILVEAGSVTPDGLKRALTDPDISDERIGERLLRQGALDAEALACGLARQLGLGYAAPPLQVSSAARDLMLQMPQNVLMLPLDLSGKCLRVAVVDPHDTAALNEVRFRSGMHIEPVLASPESIEAARNDSARPELADLIRALPRSLTQAESDLVDLAASAPVVRIVEYLLQQATVESASDIHIELIDERVRVRFRVDGVLRTRLELPAESHRPLISRLKVLAGMDIAVRRRPQDGSFSFARDSVRIRASTLPLSTGEKAVLRLLDPTGTPTSLEALGFSQTDLELVRRLGAAGQGVILAAGPTGSGKTSSLFAALAELNQEGQNVITLEDPVEYRVPGINQVHVNPKAGLTFPAALRAVLRQDPDIIMIGEIRDRETAEIAMTAAVTGHLVLSTIHTVDAPGAVTRLLDMGVPPFLVAGGLSGVVAQRLVRTLCDRCLGRDPECGHCTDGYSGRTGVFQVLALNDAMRDEITRDASAATLRRLARENGMGTLSEDARRKIAEGRTSPHEVARVVHSDPGAAMPCTHCAGDIPSSANACPYCGRARRALCSCGQALRPGWRFCPQCVRPVLRATRGWAA
jgi:type IV pilus assembly protein PilB